MHILVREFIITDTDVHITEIWVHRQSLEPVPIEKECKSGSQSLVSPPGLYGSGGCPGRIIKTATAPAGNELVVETLVPNIIHIVSQTNNNPWTSYTSFTLVSVASIFYILYSSKCVVQTTKMRER